MGLKLSIKGTNDVDWIRLTACAAILGRGFPISVCLMDCAGIGVISMAQAALGTLRLTGAKRVRIRRGRVRIV
jgi:hypothetical protein